MVLAAGGSRRLGAPKQLLTWRGTSLVRRAVAAALGAGCHPVYVVVGNRAGEVTAELSGEDAVIVENPAWEQGLSSSIAAGVRAATSGTPPDALLLVLVDQPHLSAELLGRLLGAFDGGIAACRYAGTLGVPAVFGSEYFPALTRLTGDRGARALLEVQSEAEHVRSVAWEEGAIDIDTAEDWEALSREDPSPGRHSK